MDGSGQSSAKSNYKEKGPIALFYKIQQIYKLIMAY